MNLNKATVANETNYIGVFLTLGCNLSCSYCINHLSGGLIKKGLLTAQDWAFGLNRLDGLQDVPLTLQGGEPTIYPYFYKLVKEIRADFKLDLLTNLQFDPIEFSKHISPDRFKRNSPYASIRVTYHPETMEWDLLIKKAKWMTENGYSICLYGILHPRDEEKIYQASVSAKLNGVEFRTKEFLGEYSGKIFGEYKYNDSVFSDLTKTCQCKTTELLFGPEGNLYRCHHDLYNKYNPIGNILDAKLDLSFVYRDCDKFGRCNPCDVKIKNNRLEKWGHTSVSIIDIGR